jgi:hypothetical protein
VVGHSEEGDIVESLSVTPEIVHCSQVPGNGQPACVGRKVGRETAGSCSGKRPVVKESRRCCTPRPGAHCTLRTSVRYLHAKCEPACRVHLKQCIALRGPRQWLAPIRYADALSSVFPDLHPRCGQCRQSCLKQVDVHRVTKQLRKRRHCAHHTYKSDESHLLSDPNDKAEHLCLLQQGCSHWATKRPRRSDLWVEHVML